MTKWLLQCVTDANPVGRFLPARRSLGEGGILRFASMGSPLTRSVWLLKTDRLKIVGVHPLAGFDKLLHYKVPQTMAEQVHLGSLLRIPIGRRFILGIVGVVGAPDDFPVDRLKNIAEVVYDFPALPPDLLALAKWMAVYYAAPLDGIIETMLPGAVRRAAGLKQEKLLVVAENFLTRTWLN